MECLEKDVDIKDLKEQILSLSGLVRQLQIQKAELNHRDKSQVSIFGPDVMLYLYLGIDGYILIKPK